MPASGAEGAEGATEPSQFRGEQELLRALAEKELTFADVNHFLSEFRVSCQNAIFQSLASKTGTAAAEIENKLWDMHVRINSRFRKLLSQIRDDNSRGKKRPVEQRKLSKHYLNFISASQRFYCGYIQQLLTQYNGIPELEEVAKRFDIEDYSKDSHNQVSAELHRDIVASCHSTVIRLGDLSRYYGMELSESKNRKWDRAIKYYTLACSINPHLGVAHNQLAVIALAEGDHLQATYSLYRALSASEPHPTAKGNLEIEFRKILTASKKGELFSSGEDNAALISSFVYLHAQCYKGSEFTEHDELENEILRQITVDLKERSLGVNLLQKFCLITIAADANAQATSKDKPTKDPEGSNAPLYFRRLNVKMFFTLLQVLLSELECSAEKVTPVAHQILPVLRQYSSWLLANSELLVSETEDNGLNVQIKEFWKVYASTLTLLTSTFDVANLPKVDYLLEEDEETRGFAPLVNDVTIRRLTDDSGRVKPRLSESRLPANAEMLFRIREFVVDGLDMVVNTRIPIVLTDDKDAKVFVCKEDGLPQFSNMSPQNGELSATNVEREEIQHPEPTHGIVEDGGSISATASTAMHRMVDALVESEPTDAGDDTPSACLQQPSFSVQTRHENQNIAEGNVPTDSSLQYSPRPPLPSIMNTPFAPQPGEVSPGTRPSTAQGADQRPLSTHDNSTGLLGPSGPSGFGGPQFMSDPKQSSTPMASTSSLSMTQGSSMSLHNRAAGSFQRPFPMQMGHVPQNMPTMQFPITSSPQPSYGSSWDKNPPAVNRILLDQTPPSGQGG